MFLRIATVLAILGLLLTLLLALAQQAFVQALLMGRFYGSGMQLIYKLITLGEVVSFTVPLIIFFVAFFLSLNTKQS